MSECEEIRRRYARRLERGDAERYSPLRPYTYLMVQERERVTIRCISRYVSGPLNQKRVLEVGCGQGDNLIELLQLGFSADQMVGYDLLEDRVEAARARLPNAVKIFVGDASEIDLQCGVFDFVLQSTVFTSILDKQFQHKLADKMWELTSVGGGILWYDFAYSNPRNSDVRGVPLKRIKELFPKGRIHCWRVTLAPPLGRLVARVHPLLYSAFNMFPFLRTHLLCWIAKEEKSCPRSGGQSAGAGNSEIP